MPTPGSLIASIRHVLEAEHRVIGVWLYGSHARRDADRFSDVDVLVVTGDVAGLRADWPKLAERIGPTVLTEPIAGQPAFRHVTAEWSRYDVRFETPAEFVAGHARDAVRRLFDRAGLHERLPEVTRPAGPNLGRVRGLTVELLRLLGQLPAVLHRDDAIFAATYAAMVRIIGIELLLAGATMVDPGGASRRYAALPPAQRAALAALPPVTADPASVRDATVACAAFFLPVARALDPAGFPDALYTALRDWWRRELGVNPAGTLTLTGPEDLPGSTDLRTSTSTVCP